MSEKQYVISSEELNSLHKDASVSEAIKELANILSGRSQDLPHRFKAPASLGNYLSDYGVNQTYYQLIQLPTSNQGCPLTIEITTRPTQHILEFIFQAPDGMRLFTLEIEYAVSEKG
jgi:hypothetical protein